MDASRRLMIETAEAWFATRGPAGLGLPDLARRLGLPARVVFREFKTRDELFVAVLGRVQEGLFAAIETCGPAPPDETGLSMALRLAETYSRFLEQRPAAYVGLVRGEGHPLAGLGPQSRAELQRIQARMVKQFETVLRLGHWDGSVRQEAVEEAARRFVNVLVGLVRLRLTRPETRAQNLRLMLTALAGQKHEHTS